MRREERLVVTIIAGINIVLLLMFVPFPAFAHQFKWVASVDGVRRFVVSALNVFSITRGNNSSDWLGRILVWIISWVFWILIPLTGFVWILKTSRGIATFASKNHAAVICRAPGWRGGGIESICWLVLLASNAGRSASAGLSRYAGRVCRSVERRTDL